MKGSIVWLIVFMLLCSFTIQPVNAQACQPGVAFLADVTVPDDTVYQPGTPFEKIWKLRNSGTCDWNDNYSVVFVGGDLLEAASPQLLGRTVAAGDATDIGIVMRSPMQPGTYTSRWQMQDNEGKRFGDPFYVRIRVVQIQQPQAEIVSPQPGATIAGQVAIIGSAIHPAFAYYKLEVGPGDSPSDDQMALITDLVRDQVLNGQLGLWDTTQLSDGQYSLRLRVVQPDGNYQEFWVKGLTINNAAPPAPTRQAASPTPTQQPTETSAPLSTETPTPSPESLSFTGGMVKPISTSKVTPPPTVIPLPTATFTPLPTATFTPLPTATAASAEQIPIAPVESLYENTQWGISFLYPKGWLIDDQSDESFFGVNGGPSQEALAILRDEGGGALYTGIPFPSFLMLGGPASNLPATPGPDGSISSESVLEALISVLLEEPGATEAEIKQVGEIRPLKGAEIRGSVAELVSAVGQGSMNLGAFVADDVAVVLFVIAPDAQQAEARKLTEDMAATLRIKPSAVAVTPSVPETTATSAISPTHTPTAAGGGFGFTLPTAEETPTAPPLSAPTSTPSAGAGFDFTLETPAATRQSTLATPPTATVTSAKPVAGLEVTSYSSYTDTYGYVFVVGEATNTGPVPLQNVQITLSLLNEQGDEVGVGGYNMIYLDTVPVGGKYPFRFSIDESIKGWTAVAFQTKAEPYERQKSYFKPHDALFVSNTVAHEATDKYDSFSLTGKVNSTGDVAASAVRLAVTAYDSDGKVLDANSIVLPMDLVLAGGAIPFDISLFGLDKAPSAYEIIVQGREETDLPQEQAQVPFQVRSYADYLDSFDRLNIVGEAVNKGAVPAGNIKICAAVSDDNGNVLAMSTSNWDSLELVPPGGKYPFGLQFGAEAKDAKQVEIQIQAEPYVPEKAFFKPHSGLKLEGLSGAEPESSWGGYKLSGQVANAGDVPANWVKVVAVAYDATGAVVDVGNATPKTDGDLLPGASAPFELEFRGLKEEPASYQAFVQGHEVEQ